MYLRFNPTCNPIIPTSLLGIHSHVPTIFQHVFPCTRKVCCPSLYFLTYILYFSFVFCVFFTPTCLLLYNTESSCFQRTCCKNNRAMKQTVWVGQNESAMTAANNLPVVMGQKGLTCGVAACSCCFNPYLDLFSGQNEPMGKVTVPFFFCIPAYKVFNDQNVQEYDIHMPTCCGGMCVNCCAQGCCNCKIPFYIYRPDQTDRGKGQEIGNIIKQWRGLGTEMFTDADTFTIDFPKDANTDQKARLLGATFLLNMMEFEKPQKDK